MEANNLYEESLGWGSLWKIWSGTAPSEKWPLSSDQTGRYSDYLKRTNDDGFKAGCLWIRENPLQYVKLCSVRFRAVVGPITGHMKLANRMLSTAWWLIVFPAGFYGLWKYRRWRVSKLAALIILALVSFETFIMSPSQPRYRVPMDMMLVVYASVIYAEIAARWVDIDRFDSAEIPPQKNSPGSGQVSGLAEV